MKIFRNVLNVIMGCFLACTFFLASCAETGDSSSSTGGSPALPVTKIVVSEEYVELLVGDSYDISATAYVQEEKVETALTWESLNPTVATVKNGKITANGGGNTTVRVSYGEIVESVNVFVAKRIMAKNVNTFDESYINVYGRSYIAEGKLNLDHCANAVELAIIGTSLTLDIASTTNSYMRVFTDNDAEGERISVMVGTNTYTVVKDLPNGYHKIRIVKATEMLHSSWDISNFNATAFATIPEKSDLKIEFIGDSITAGNANLGSEGDAWSVDNSDSAKTYAYFTAQELSANYSIVAMSGISTKVYHWTKDINMTTLYGYTSYLNTQTYAFNFNPDIIVLNLGTNDANYMGKPEGANYGSQFPTDYYNFLSAVREKNPNAYIICLYGMMGKNGRVDVGIQTAISNMNDSKIVYNPFEFQPNTSGGASHPSLTAQKTWGEALAAYITGLNVANNR